MGLFEPRTTAGPDLARLSGEFSVTLTVSYHRMGGTPSTPFRSRAHAQVSIAYSPCPVLPALGSLGLDIPMTTGSTVRLHLSVGSGYPIASSTSDIVVSSTTEWR